MNVLLLLRVARAGGRQVLASPTGVVRHWGGGENLKTWEPEKLATWVPCRFSEFQDFRIPPMRRTAPRPGFAISRNSSANVYVGHPFSARI